MSLRIDHLCLHLPPRCAAWRPLIARRLAGELADLAPGQPLATGRLDLDRLDLGRLTLPAEAGPEELARLIADRLRDCLARELARADSGRPPTADPDPHPGGRP